MKRANKRRRRLPRRTRQEYLTTSGVVVNILVGLAGLAIAAVGVHVLIDLVVDGTHPLAVVGIARPAPAWMGGIASVLGIVGGWSLFFGSAGYLYRCATGRVIRLSREELKKHRRLLAERQRELRSED